MRRQRILVLMHEDLVPPPSLEGLTQKEIAPWKTEYDVVANLQNAGHEARPLGVSSDLTVVREVIDDFKPHVCFNLLEEFHGVSLYDQHVVSYLELLRQPYTGCNPRGLTLSHDKALTRKVLGYHRIPVPKFAVFRVGRRIQRPARLEFPLIVKSLTEHASLGISQASVVTSDDKLAERVRFIHEQIGTDAIVEQYIDGREVYVSILGNQRLQVFPIWELFLKNLPEGAPRIATEKVKWDEDYQQKVGLSIGPAQGLSKELTDRIVRTCKRTYRALEMTGYARIDLRMSDDERIYVLEANPNPDIGYGEEFAESANAAGMGYEKLMTKIVNLGLSYRPAWRQA
ncbi:MAG: ATP-grasp domain-containing protein [Pseudomonadota bacterium]